MNSDDQACRNPALQRKKREPENLAKLTDAWRGTVAVVPTSALHDVIASAGFTRPVTFFQTLLIHAAVARRIG